VRRNLGNAIVPMGRGNLFEKLLFINDFGGNPVEDRCRNWIAWKVSLRDYPHSAVGAGCMTLPSNIMGGAGAIASDVPTIQPTMT